MVQVCSRCQRANPKDAVYCYFDGIVLAAGGPALAVAGQELTFPSGRRCRTLDDLVQACYTEWDQARDLLVQGMLARFLGQVGRADLASAAQQAQALPDPDVALHTLIGNLPAPQGQLPRLELAPRRLIVGPIAVGSQSAVSFTVSNLGQGILQGRLTVTDGHSWLKVVGGSSDRHLSLHVGRNQGITLRVDSERLVAPQSYTGKVTAITNGGIAEVALRLDLSVVPFARAPFQGASSAQEMAKRMRQNPKPAIDLLTNGEIARWFAANGWSYPIAGSAIAGMAAVQQFFDALGLAKPPALELSQKDFRLRANVPQKLREQVVLRTADKKLVYAQIDSDSPWLKPVAPTATGQQQALIPFEVDASLMNDDALFVGNLRIVANANQTFSVRVSVDVKGNPPSNRARPAPIPAPARAPVLAPILAPAAPAVPASVAINNRPAFWEQPAPANPPAPVRGPQPVVQSVPPTPTAPMPVFAPPPSYVPPAPRPAPAQQAIQPAPQVHGIQEDWAATVAPAARSPARPRRVGLFQPLLVGALTALIVRLLLVAPGDLLARLLFNRIQGPAPGTLERWARSPLSEENFLSVFVLSTWWLGAFVGVVLVYQKGGRFADLLCGAAAGAWAGLAACATLGCAMALIDFVPRLLLKAVPSSVSIPAVVATLLWLALAPLCWTLLGAGLGMVLTMAGRRGAAAMALLALPLAWVCRLCRLDRAADFFLLQGS